MMYIKALAASAVAVSVLAAVPVRGANLDELWSAAVFSGMIVPQPLRMRCMTERSARQLLSSAACLPFVYRMLNVPRAEWRTLVDKCVKTCVNFAPLWKLADTVRVQAESVKFCRSSAPSHVKSKTTVLRCSGTVQCTSVSHQCNQFTTYQAIVWQSN